MIFKNPRRNAFIPLLLFLLNIPFNRLIEIFRIIPSCHWIYEWGKLISLFGVIFIGIIIFPFINMCYFGYEKTETKFNNVYIAASFLPFLYFIYSFCMMM